MTEACLYLGPKRTEGEDMSFKRALKAVNIWYAHNLSFVWLLTVVPDGVKAYGLRGWPCFERAVATLLKDSWMVLDLGAGYEDNDTYEGMRDKCIAGRPAPCTPMAFRKKLKDLHFTNGADRSFVLGKFLETFTEVIGSAKMLDYSNLGWGDAEARAVAEALPWCRRAETLSLKLNKIGDEGARAIGEGLKTNSTLKTLGLGGSEEARSATRALARLERG